MCAMVLIEGLDAVQIGLKSGSKFWIGTDEPEELISALKQSVDVMGYRQEAMG